MRAKRDGPVDRRPQGDARLSRDRIGLAPSDDDS